MRDLPTLLLMLAVGVLLGVNGVVIYETETHTGIVTQHPAP